MFHTNYCFLTRLAALKLIWVCTRKEQKLYLGQRDVLSNECTLKSYKMRAKMSSGMEGLIPEISAPMMGEREHNILMLPHSVPPGH